MSIQKLRIILCVITAVLSVTWLLLVFWDQIKIFLEEVKKPQNTKEAIKLLFDHLF